MTGLHTEIHFENDVCEFLEKNGWLYSKDDTGYDRELALFPEDAIEWLKSTQDKEWAKVKALHNGSSEKTIINRLADILDKDGSLAVLRHGFKNISAKFAMCQFRPSQSMNQDTLDKYGQVRLRVMRQVHYSLSNQNSIDLVFFVNGIPVATAELKTDFTQSVNDAIDQYKYDRSPRDLVNKRDEPLLTFKRRALVHFAVSSDEVFMTTHLKGKDTQFLPFNLGDGGGKGNPVNLTGYRTSYLWERVLHRDSWLDIIGRFVHLEKEVIIHDDGTPQEKFSMIFPRFHQWEAVKNLVDTAKAEGAGHKYLIQHSAGSGKTNSIAWTAHQLASLHDAADKKSFDSVIVITDRNVLDTQLQEAIYQFEHKHGVVEKITDERGSKSSQLTKALTDRVPIIIVTIQTFPFVLDAIRETVSLKDRKFAVIADEAHSSQTGNTAKKLKQVLSSERLMEVEDGGEIDIEELLEAEMAGRLQPDNISFFAFTATPKAKTMELFGRVGDSGLPEPFHVYSMRQAIEEGFILDVLKNYTPYRLAFRLAFNGQDYDSEQVDQSKALKSLMRWVRLHPHNISQKVQVIIEHFRANVAWRLDGKAKAMVVTSSRKEAVRYKLAIDKYITTQGYRDVSTLVAFSGDVNDSESGPEAFNERNMNPNLKGRELRDAFDTDEYQIMLVANKFQTGFDQPKLVAMYVDKKLSGVATVQTLSRLNRTYPGKTDTFILDFVNDQDEILLEFRKYFETAQLSDVTDPNLIHDLQTKLDAVGIYTDVEVRGFVEAYINPKARQADIQAKIAPAVQRFRNRMVEAKKDAKNNKKEIDRLELFRKDIGSFVRAYDFLSQIVDYGDTDLERRSIFFKHLSPLIAEDARTGEIDLTDILMTHYNLRDRGNRDLWNTKSDDDDEDKTKLKPLTGTGTGVPKDPMQALLKEVVAQMNELFEGQELTDADKINYASHIRDKMMESEVLAKQSSANNKDQFGDSPDFMQVFEDAVISAYQSHKSMSEQVMSKGHVKKAMAAMLLDLVYKGFEERRAE